MRKARDQLIRFLETKPGAVASKRELAEELWPGHDPQAAENQLRATVFRLRKDGHRIETVHCYRLIRRAP